MTTILNSQIQQLADALCDAALPPTRKQIQTAMALAYEAGQCDGRLEVCEQWAQSYADIREREATDAELRG